MEKIWKSPSGKGTKDRAKKQTPGNGTPVSISKRNLDMHSPQEDSNAEHKTDAENSEGEKENPFVVTANTSSANLNDKLDLALKDLSSEGDSGVHCQ